MIPKIIHQIWIGKNPMPFESILFSLMWKAMYPDFEYILWNDNNIDVNQMFDTEKVKFYNSTDFKTALKADLLRYEILEKFGGIYIDVDFEPLRRINEDTFEYDFFSGKQLIDSVAIGIIGCCKGNELLKEVNRDVTRNISSELEKGAYTCEVQRLSGPDFFTKVCQRYFDNPKYKFFDPKYFYPYWFAEPHRRHENFKETSPESYAVHHWYKSWA